MKYYFRIFKNYLLVLLLICAAFSNLSYGIESSLGGENGISIIDDDQIALEVRFDAIAMAKREVLVSYFLINDDETARKFLSMLWKKASEGVRVRIIVDALYNKIPLAYRNHLINSGVKIKVYNKRNILRLGEMIKYRLHDKLLIVDGKHLVIGGRNIHEDYFGNGDNNYKDRDVYVKGPVAQEAKLYHDSLWEADHLSDINFKSHHNRCRIYKASENRSPKDRYQSCLEDMKRMSDLAIKEIERNLYQYYSDQKKLILSQKDLVIDTLKEKSVADLERVDRAEVIHDDISRWKRRNGRASTRLYEILRSAEKSIIIENPYLILTDELEQLFKKLISDGVTVSIVTNSLKTTDGILPQAAYLNDSLNILKIGVRLYEFFGDKRLHSKSFVVDDKIAIIGTYNLDPRSQNLNTETLIAIYDKESALLLRKRIGENIALSYELQKNGLPLGMNKRLPEVSFTKRLMTRMIQAVFAPFAKDLL